MGEMMIMASFFWWGKLVFITIFSLFFLIYGMEALVGSFYLKNPVEFIMHFFSASLIVLISTVGIIYPAFQIHNYLRLRKIGNDSK